jgi:hypothetical protein
LAVLEIFAPVFGLFFACFTLFCSIYILLFSAKKPVFRKNLPMLYLGIFLAEGNKEAMLKAPGPGVRSLSGQALKEPSHKELFQ